MTLTDIAPETWLLAGGLAVVLVLLLVLVLRQPKAGDGFSADQAETLRAERDDWRARAETAQAELSLSRQDVARLESVAGERDRLQATLETLRQEKDALDRRFASLDAAHKAAQEHHAEKLAELDKARERLTEQFKLTANDILKSSGAELHRQSTENLQSLLKPLRDQLTDFRTKVETDAKERSGHAGEIKALMDTVRKDAARMSEDAQNLTKALTSSSKVQGDWGELFLESILERAGLREGEHYHTQSTERDGEGRLLKPDVVVEMPGGHKLVIDSKVSLTAFQQCMTLEDETERERALKRHVDSIRNHIKGLGEKDYAKLYPGVDFTLMFVPLEGAAMLALQNDPDIAGFAWDRNVIITTQTTLMMAMRTVGNLWTVDRQNRHAIDIADRAGALYDKFDGFVGDLEAVGRRIDSAKDAWTSAKGKLVDGRGNLVRQAEMLKQLGANARKSLPADYLDAAGVDAPEVQALAAPDAPEAADS